MKFFVFFMIFYGIPITLGILLIRRIFIKFGSKTRANKIAMILFAILIATGVFLSIQDYNSRRHLLKLSLCDYLELEVKAIEIDTFLDYPVQFEIIITNKINGTVKHVEIETYNGPGLEFALDENNVLTIKELDDNFSNFKSVKLTSLSPLCITILRIEENFTITSK